jgi:hypothetical protein
MRVKIYDREVKSGKGQCQILRLCCQLKKQHNRNDVIPKYLRVGGNLLLPFTLVKLFWLSA